MYKKTAIITGASSGLGKEFLRQLLPDSSIEEFIIIARRKDRLDALAATCPERITVYPLDLCDSNQLLEFVKYLDYKRPYITHLINKAGIGKVGSAAETSLNDTDRMIHLNCRAMADMVCICLPFMHEYSKIINISSVAGFTPLPGFSIYSATKAFVQTYSKALHQELKGRHIQVTCVCPYWIKDTEFISLAQDNGNPNYHTMPFPSNSQEVVRIALKDSAHNRSLSTPGAISTALRYISKITPDCLSVKIADIARKL